MNREYRVFAKIRKHDGRRQTKSADVVANSKQAAIDSVRSDFEKEGRCTVKAVILDKPKADPR